MTAAGHDLFGQALCDHFEGRRETPFRLRRDDGQVLKVPLARYFSTPPLPDEAGVIGTMGGHVLDIGAGAGRYLLWAETQGLAATGLEISPMAAALCRRRGAHDVRLGDVLDPGLELPRFDTGLLFGQNIGIAGTEAGARRLLARLRERVAPGGRLLLTSRDCSLTENPVHLAYHARNRASGQPIGQLRLRAEYGDARDGWFDWLHLMPGELAALAAATGWEMRAEPSAADGAYAATLSPV